MLAEFIFSEQFFFQYCLLVYLLTITYIGPLHGFLFVTAFSQEWGINFSKTYKAIEVRAKWFKIGPHLAFFVISTDIKVWRKRTMKTQRYVLMSWLMAKGAKARLLFPQNLFIRFWFSLYSRSIWLSKYG